MFAPASLRGPAGGEGAGVTTDTDFRASFRVDGTPRGQPRPKAFVRNGHASVYDPGTAGEWKARIAEAGRPHRPAAPLECALSVRMDFAMPRPKRLKAGRVEFCTSRPDVDNLAKAALEASVRYLAADLGPDAIRVNAISAGPMRTLAGSAIGSARKTFKYNQLASPLRRSVELEELGQTGVYLLSDMSTAVTGEIHYVDCGFNVVGMCPTDQWEELLG